MDEEDLSRNISLCDLEKSSALSSFGRRSSSYKDFVKEINILTSKESLINIFIL
jgi:hypothetical protein